MPQIINRIRQWFVNITGTLNNISKTLKSIDGRLEELEKVVRNGRYGPYVNTSKLSPP